MDLSEIRQRFPRLNPEELFPEFPRFEPEDFAPLEGMSWEEWHRGFIGGGGLYLVAEMAEKLNLQPGMRVLDLACGNATSSVFLAKRYGVTAYAVDANADPSKNWRRVQAAGLDQVVLPLQLDAHALPFAHNFFDAVFCLNSYFYFGGSETYLPYLLRFLKPEGRVGIVNPCYKQELNEETPPELLYDAPENEESMLVHSPGWWLELFEREPLVDVLECAEHPRGREIWLDDTRWLLEQMRIGQLALALQPMLLQQITMLLSDEQHWVTYLTLLAEKRHIEPPAAT